MTILKRPLRKPLLAVIAAIGVAALLSGCPFGGGSSDTGTKLNAVIEDSVPAEATVGSTFYVAVQLAPAPVTLTHPQADVPGSTSNMGSSLVSVVDVSSSVPPISCGGAQKITIGDLVYFPCQASAVVSGGDNEHHLQIRAPGTTDPVADAYVEIVNRGLVLDKLTNLSGNPIATISPGESFWVAFSAAAHQASAGKYTISVPAEWTIVGSDSCEFPHGDFMCKLKIQLPPDAPMGLTDYVHINAASGSTRLDRYYFPIKVVPIASLGGTESALSYDYSENISDTLYANTESSKVKFTYKPIFTFEANKAVQITSVVVGGLDVKSLSYTCAGRSSAKSDCHLSKGEKYAVSGTLPNNFGREKLPKRAVVSIYVKDGKTILSAESVRVEYVKFVKDHVALRVVDHVTNNPLYIGAFSALGWISFDKKTGEGTAGGANAFRKDSYEIKRPEEGPSTDVIYLPYGQGAKIYIARGRNFVSNPTPSTTALPLPPPFLVLEETYLDTTQGPCLAPCDDLTVDMSYVNSISIAATFNVMGNAGNNAGQTDEPLITQNATYGVVDNYTSSKLLDTAYDKLDKFPYWKGLIIKSSNPKSSTQLGVRGPVSVWGVANASINGHSYVINPFPDNYYVDYINKIWDYYKKHPMYVLADGTSDEKGTTRTPTGCILKGQVNKDNLLVFTEAKKYPGFGSCPAEGYVKAGLTGWTAGQKSCVKDKKKVYCADTPSLVFEKFNACDFFTAAGSDTCHNKNGVTAQTFFENEGMWGPNGTFRAVVGRAIVAYQAAGMLPPPTAFSKEKTPTCAPSATTVLRKKNAIADVNEVLEKFGALKSTPCFKASIPTYDVYSSILLPLANVYNYSYGDFLGHDGTVSFSKTAVTGPALPKAQPVTVYLQ